MKTIFDFIGYYGITYDKVIIWIKLNNLESNLGCIIKSNEKDLIYFNKYSNIKKFTTFAFDIKFNNNSNPVIFEDNFYFTRSFPNTKYGIDTIKMYNDIFYEMNLSKKVIMDFYIYNYFIFLSVKLYSLSFYSSFEYKNKQTIYKS